MKKFILLTLLFLIGCGSSTPAAPNVTPEPTATLRPRILFQKMIREEVPSVIVSDAPNGYLVKFDVSDNVREDLIFYGAQQDVAHILKSAKDSRADYFEIFIEGYFEYFDNFGNGEELMVIRLTYSKATIDKINFDNFSPRNVYAIADRATLHPDFQE